MSLVAVATGAARLDPAHAVGIVLDGRRVGLVERGVEAGPAGAALELCLMPEQRQAAFSAAIDAGRFLAEQAAAERRLGAVLQQHPKPDAETVRKASRAQWGELLEAGIEISEYQPTMYHCKVIIVDEIWVSVGSTNFDDRSFRLNDEVNLNIYDAAFAAAQTKVFEQDLGRSRRVSRAEFKHRSPVGKLCGQLASLLRRQL